MKILPLLLLTFLLAAGGGLGAERFPTPEFESGHKLPFTQVPAPRAGGLEALDVLVLAATLAAASYLVIRRRSRRGLWLLTVFSLIYFGFWRKGCICPIGAIQNVVSAACDPTYALPLVALAFFVLPLVFVLFFGRVFCAAVCPLGAIQDVMVLKPLAIPRWLEQALGLAAVLYFGLAVLFAATGSAYVICRFDPFISLFRLTGDAEALALGACVLILGVFVARPYCRFLCPYGVLLGWLSKFARRQATVTPDECIHCRLCEDACPFGAINKPTPEWSATEHAAARRIMALLIVLLPVLTFTGALLGGRMGEPLARMHPTVRLADRLWLENSGRTKGAVNETIAFRRTGQNVKELNAAAAGLSRRFAFGARMLGGFAGMVIGGKLIGLSVRRRRADYVPDRSLCLACGRCFLYCPREHVRLGRIGKGSHEVGAPRV